MRAILALTGIELEARALARALELPRLPLGGPTAYGGGMLRLAPVGLGAARLESRWPDLVAGLDHPLVISAGVCGGLDPALRAGDLVVPARVLGRSGESLPVSAPDHDAAVRAAPSAAVGAMVTVDGVAATPAAKARLFARAGAVAADMESAAIVACAARAGLPCLVIRAVSDTAAEEVPAALSGMVTADGRLTLAGAGGLLARPAALLRAVGLQRATRRALGAVAAVLATLAAGLGSEVPSGGRPR